MPTNNHDRTDLFALASQRPVRLYDVDEQKLKEQAEATGLSIVHLIRAFVHLGIETQERNKNKRATSKKKAP